jgi:urocanate reductase
LKNRQAYFCCKYNFDFFTIFQQNQSKNDTEPIIIDNGGTMKNLSIVTMLFALLMIFSACESLGNGNGSSQQLYRAGTYEGSGDGYFGLVTVSVTVTENAVAEVEVLSHADTDGIGTTAFEELTQTIIFTNSPDVDVISGATGSSEGFIEAVNDALLKAKLE